MVHMLRYFGDRTTISQRGIIMLRWSRVRLRERSDAAGDACATRVDIRQ
jgi:hypothetical protein